MRIFFVLALVALLQACATSFHTELDPEKRAAIQNVDVYNLVNQDEIMSAVKTAGAAGGGLLGVMIGSAVDKGRSKTAQEIIEPLWMATEDFNYRELSGSVLGESLVKEFVLTNQPTSAEAAVLSKMELLGRINGLSVGSAFMYVSSYYTFVNESKQILTMLVANIYDAPVTPLTKPSKPIYRNQFFHQSASLGAGGEDSVQLWLNDDASAFYSALKEGLARTADSLNYDLVPHPEEACAQQAKIKMVNIYLDTMQKIRGQIIDNNDSLVRIRNSGGLIYSITGAAEAVLPAGSKTAAKCKQQQVAKGE